MKPFNLEAALRGEKVITRDGREVTQLTHFKCAAEFPLYGVINDLLSTWYENGLTVLGKKEYDADLFMATKMKKISYRFYKSNFIQPGVAVGSVDFLGHLQNKIWLSDILEVEIEDND